MFRFGCMAPRTSINSFIVQNCDGQKIIKMCPMNFLKEATNGCEIHIAVRNIW